LFYSLNKYLFSRSDHVNNVNFCCKYAGCVFRLNNVHISCNNGGFFLLRKR
jgi:hypothetical protein